MKSKTGAPLVLRALGLALAAFAWVAVPAHASTLQLAAPETDADANAPKSSSWWLRAGEAREQQGEYAKAGDAYRQALAALSEKKQKANEGARAAILSADAYWKAFDGEPNVIHLDAGLAVLEHWLALTGPQSRASMRSDVQRMVSRMKAVREPLVAADVAIAAGDAKTAAEHDEAVLDALSNQQRDWSVGARVALRASATFVETYEAEVHTPADVKPHLHELKTARNLLTRWKKERPPDDASEQGPAVDRALADVEARIAKAEQEVADAERAEKLRKAQQKAEEAKRRAEQREAKRIAAEQAREVRAAKAAQQRKLAIALLSTGVVATAAGAGLLGEGAVFSGVAKDRAAAAAAEADGIEQMNGDGFDDAGFDTELEAYRDAADRRNLGMIVGGSVLAAGGLATSVAGIVLLARGRSSGGKRADRARLSPVISPTLLQLSISGRF
jgi:hypothetical protein